MTFKFDLSDSSFLYTVALLPSPADGLLIPVLRRIEATGAHIDDFKAVFGWTQVPIEPIDSFEGCEPFYTFAVAVSTSLPPVTVVARDWGTVIACVKADL